MSRRPAGVGCGRHGDRRAGGTCAGLAPRMSGGRADALTLTPVPPGLSG
ncbi:MAG: hypothetical protein ACOVME_01220 [Rhodobacter sp.]